MRETAAGLQTRRGRRAIYGLMTGLALTFLPVTTVMAQQAAGAPFVHHDLYPQAADASSDIAAALKQARQQHKRVLLVFGGNWCSDCVILNNKLHDATNGPLMERSYVLVHVNVGHMDENVELAHQYGISLAHGVPGVSVVAANGKVVHAQPNGELADVRHMDSSAVTQFLNEWKG